MSLHGRKAKCYHKWIWYSFFKPQKYRTWNISKRRRLGNGNKWGNLNTKHFENNRDLLKKIHCESIPSMTLLNGNLKYHISRLLKRLHVLFFTLYFDNLLGASVLFGDSSPSFQGLISEGLSERLTVSSYRVPPPPWTLS